MTMPFGKHKGEELEDIPVGYLEWVLENCTNIKPWLRDAICEVLGIDAPTSRPRAPSPKMPDGIVGRWYSELVKRWHPDRGGSVEAMQAINDAKELLVVLMEEQP
jgi:hypothetical protein